MESVSPSCPPCSGLSGDTQHFASVAFTSSSRLLSRVASPHFPSTDTDFSPWRRRDARCVGNYTEVLPHNRACCRFEFSKYCLMSGRFQNQNKVRGSQGDDKWNLD